MIHSLRAVLFIVSLLAASAIAAPANIQKRSFVHHVKRTINRRDPGVGPDAMLKAYRKFGFQLVGRAANTTAAPAAGAGTGTVVAAPEPNAAEYLSPVNIGGQTVTLDFDTGSSDLYVILSSLSKLYTNVYQVGIQQCSFQANHWTTQCIRPSTEQVFPGHARCYMVNLVR